MSLSDELAAKDALIQKLLSERHTQTELLKEQCKVLAQYLILDIEDYLADVRAKAEEAEEGSDHGLHQPKLPKYHHLHFGHFNGVSLWRAIWHPAVDMWEQWATNAYRLHPAWYAMIMTLLLLWMFGSLIVGYFEVGAVSGSLRIARFGRACLGAIPPIVQFLLFLFPPLFVQF